jgi:hypothetical protein
MAAVALAPFAPCTVVDAALWRKSYLADLVSEVLIQNLRQGPNFGQAAAAHARYRAHFDHSQTGRHFVTSCKHRDLQTSIISTTTIFHGREKSVDR